MSRPHTAVGTSPTGLSGATGSHRGRARRRAVGPRRRLYFVLVRTRPMVHWGRSPAAVLEFIEGRATLVVLNTTRGGKGLTPFPPREIRYPSEPSVGRRSTSGAIKSAHVGPW